METSEFFKKICSVNLWLNLLGMGVVIFLLVIGAHFGMNLYTHHGESIAVPELMKKDIQTAEMLAEELGMEICVQDTGYNKLLPPGVILQQLPVGGTLVKSGRIIYVTINGTDCPTLSIPDIVENCSYREAQARLIAMGFRVGPAKEVPGEKDWVVGLLVNGRHVSYRDRVPKESLIIIEVGNGHYGEDVEGVDMPADYDVEEGDEMMGDEMLEDGQTAVGEQSEGDDFEVVE